MCSGHVQRPLPPAARPCAAAMCTAPAERPPPPVAGNLGRYLLVTMAMASSALRTVLVTGGNKGIGKAICKRIVCDHADARVLLGSRDVSRGEAAAASIVEEEPSAAGRIEVVLPEPGEEEPEVVVRRRGDDSGAFQEAGHLPQARTELQSCRAVLRGAGLEIHPAF